MENRGLSHVIAMALVASGTAVPAVAQEQAAPVAGVAMDTQSSDIVVTARRRGESLLSVPVSVTAVTGDQLSARGISNMEGIARTVPGLILAEANGSFQGGALALRGIGASDGNNFADQAVGFYIDGVMVARSTPRKMSELDLQQVEVLKGPQALYYGKNSPGGVVILRSADPTDTLEFGAQASYEFRAREWRGQSYISTPLTDSLGLRLAVGVSKMGGWLKNIATPGTIYEPDDRREPSDREINTRLTLKFDNGGPFNARFKFTYGDFKNNGTNSGGQTVNCPLGYSQAGGPGSPDDCTADNRTVLAYAGPRFGTGGINTVTGAVIPGNPYFGDGKPYLRIKQYLSGLELSYDLADTLTLMSTTGFYQANIDAFHLLNTDTSFPYNPAAGEAGVGGIVPAVIGLDIREISQELRLASSFEGPINFMIGGYFQDQKMEQPISASINAVNPIALFPPFRAKQKGTSYSFFASTTMQPTETLELSGGLRYSHEKKKVEFSRVLGGQLPASEGGATYVAGTVIPTDMPERSFDNVSPEVVLSWRPTQRLTVFGGWKRGFLSGGFNPGGGGTNVAVLPDRSYDQQIVEGFEAGVKGSFLDGMLRTNLAVFDYKIKGLQASRVDPANGSQSISNAADASSKGFELDALIYTPLEGLSLNGAVAYTKARYDRYDTGPCYGGQSIAAGCNLGFNAARGAFTQQDLSGQPLVRAPDWGLALGANYEREDGAGNTFGLSINGNYSSKIYTDAANTPGSLQKSYWLLDASARYEMANGIEISLIGRNLTNTYYFQRSADSTLTGFGTGTANAILADTNAGVSRPREIMIRLAYKFR